MERTSRRAVHALAIAALAACVGLWVWPLVTDGTTAIPGGGPGDNLTFVWNVWWVRHSAAAGASLLWCPVLFAPFGVNLTLHTHTLAPSAIAALLSVHTTIIAGLNVVIVAHLLLNFLCAYALAWAVTRRVAAASLGAIVFGWSPYVGMHLTGHFNLIGAWVLPLVALAALKAFTVSSVSAAAVLGLLMGFVAFVDYYYAVYAAALVAVIAFQRSVSVSRAGRQPRRWQRLSVMVLTALAGVALILAFLIWITGGTTASVGSVRLSMRSADNPIAAAGLLCGLILATHWLPSLRLALNRPAAARTLRVIATASLVGAVVATPLIVSGFQLWRSGDYVSQQYFWKSAPRGIDLATVLLGNPNGLVWQGLTPQAYARFNIDPIEQVAWFGPGVLILCAVALRGWRREEAVRHWAIVALLFVIWAAGPYAVAFGKSLSVWLPAVLVRYVPVVSNARIPGRAIVVVYLASAVLAAIGFRVLWERPRRRLAWALSGVILLDAFPARLVTFQPQIPDIYHVLNRQAEPGAVCELPLGLRDGFGRTPHFDELRLFYQTLHQRPMAGGFVARLPPRVTASYEQSDALGPLYRLSTGKRLIDEPLAPPEEAGRRLRELGFRFVLVDRRHASVDLQEYVQTRLPTVVIAQDPDRTLYSLR